MTATSELLYHGRKPRNVFELSAAEVHASQPARVERVYLGYTALYQPAKKRKVEQRDKEEHRIDNILTERWQRWCKRVGRRYAHLIPDAEIQAILLGRAVWELRLCGWNYDDTGKDGRKIIGWWLTKCVRSRYSIILSSRGNKHEGRRSIRSLLLQQIEKTTSSIHVRVG